MPLNISKYMFLLTLVAVHNRCRQCRVVSFRSANRADLFPYLPRRQSIFILFLQIPAEASLRRPVLAGWCWLVLDVENPGINANVFFGPLDESFIKVHIFWGGLKILQNLHHRFVLCSVSHIYDGNFSEYMNLKNLVNTYGRRISKKIQNWIHSNLVVSSA